MLFNAATDNQNKNVDYAILPDKPSIGEPSEDKNDRLKLKNDKKNYTK